MAVVWAIKHYSAWTMKLWKFISGFLWSLWYMLRRYSTLVPAVNMHGCGYRSMEVGCRVEISTNQGKRTQELMHSPIKQISNLDTTEHLRKGVTLWFWHGPAEGPWTATDTSIPGIWILPADDAAARSLAAQALNFSQHALLCGQEEGRKTERTYLNNLETLTTMKERCFWCIPDCKNLNCKWWWHILYKEATVTGVGRYCSG